MAKLILKYSMDGLPPGVNDLYRNVPGKGRVLTAEGKQWKEAITEYVGFVVNQMEPRPVLTKKDRLGIDIVRHTYLPLQFDWDGKVKIIQDCTMKVLGLDDRYIFNGNVRKVKDDYNWFEVSLWLVE
jgi:hypothetical protein